MENVGMAAVWAEETLVVWSLLGTMLGTMVLVAAILWAGTQATQQARGLWRTVRGQRSAVIGAVDEPDDPAIRALASLSRVPAGVWAAVLPAFVAALADGLDRVVGTESEPDDPA